MNELMLNLQQFHFLRPWWWLAMLPLILLVLSYKTHYLSNSAWQKVCDPHLLPYLLKSQFKKRTNLWLWGVFFTGFIMIFSLAGPTWQYRIQPTFQKKLNRIIVMDLSANTLATDLPPSRIIRERYKLRDLLQQSDEGDVGLVVYAGEAYTVSPLTSDAKTITTMVNNLRPSIMPVQGHRLSSGLQLAEKLFKGANQAQGNIIVLSAGVIDAQAITIAKQLAKKGYKTSVLGIGSQQQAPLKDNNDAFLHNQQGDILFSQYHASSLQALANAGDGIYLPFSNGNDDIQKLLQHPKNQSLMQAKKSQLKTKNWQDEGHWFIFCLLPLVLLAFRRNFIKRITG